jgi:hypothetical protein
MQAQEPRFRRLRVSGELVVRGASEESRGTLRDLSEAGAGAVNLVPPVSAGTRVKLTLLAGIYKVGPIDSDVIWSQGSAAGFHFIEITPEAMRVLALSLASFT